jgi:hypothetical protein
MSLEFMAKSFLPYFKVPKLSKLEITTASVIIDNEWNFVIDSIRVDGIEEIICHSMTEHLSFLARFIAEFKSIVRVEIRGDSVDAVLSYLSNEHAKERLVFPALARLTVNSYAGSGESILSYIQARSLVTRLNNPLHCKNPKVILDGCTHMTLETRLRLQELLLIGEKVGGYSQGSSALF